MNLKRYTLAVYLLLATVSIILILVSLNYFVENSPLQSLLLNLGTEIAGAVLIFTIVNRVFALGEKDDGGELRLLRQEIQEQFNPFSAADEKNSSSVFLQNNLPHASRIDIVAYTRVVLLRQNRPLFFEALRRGVHVRLILVDHHSKAGEVIIENSKNPDVARGDYSNALDYITEIMEAKKEDKTLRGKFEVRLTHWIPSCSAIFVHSKQVHLSKARIAIFPLAIPSTDKRRRALLLDGQRHLEDIEYFSRQFQMLWEKKYTEFPPQ